MLAPLKDLVSRPGFQALAAMRGDNGSTRAQRDALLQALAETYQPQVVHRLADFLDGFLRQPRSAETSAPAEAAAPAQPPRSMPLRSLTVAETVILEEEAMAFDLQPSQATASTPIAWVPPQAAVAQAKPGWASGRGILLLGLGVALAGLGGAAALRGNLLCAPLGICSAAAIQSATMALERAQMAATDLDKAPDLPAYERSLGELERQLDKIESDAGLSDKQRNLRARLQTQLGQARIRLQQENNHRLTVQRVSTESATVGKLAPQAAEERRAALRRRLGTVPAASFAAPKAKELRQRLEPPPPPPPAPVSAPPASAASTWQAPPRGWTPPPRERFNPPPASSAHDGAIGAPYRDEPIW